MAEVWGRVSRELFDQVVQGAAEAMARDRDEGAIRLEDHPRSSSETGVMDKRTTVPRPSIR